MVNNCKKRRINNQCACSLPWCNETRAQSVLKECTVPFPAPGAPEFDYHTALLNVDSNICLTPILGEYTVSGVSSIWSLSGSESGVKLSSETVFWDCLF